MRREPKKSETLQVRLPHGMKRDFMQRCEQENRPASDVLRDFIDAYLARPVEILTSEKAVMIRRTFVYPALALAALVGGVVVLAPATSQATSLRADFAALDEDDDGLLSLAEFKRPDDGVTYSVVPPDDARPRKTGFTLGSPGLAATFDRLDIDRDKRLSFEEYRVMRVGAAMAVFKLGDTDRDQRLTRDEYVAGATFPPDAVAQLKAKAPDPLIDLAVRKMRKEAIARFQRLDVDEDGLLTLDEITPG